MPYNPVDGKYTPDFGPESYVPPGIVAYPAEVACVFLPDPARHPRPPGGYHWTLRVNFTAFTVSTMLSVIGPNSEYEYRFIENGGAIVYMTVVKTVVTPPYDVPGNALFWPDAFVPAGWTGVFPPGDDLSRPSPERDVAFATGWARFNAQRFGLAKTRAGYYGDSAGAHVCLMPMLGPELRRRWGRGGQHDESTRLRAGVFTHAQLYWPAYSSAMVVRHFAGVGGAPDFEAPCANLGDAFTEAKEAGSPLIYGDPVHLDSLKVTLWGDEVPTDTADFSIPHADTEVSAHTTWDDYAAHALHPQWRHWVTAAVNAGVPAPPVAPDAIVEAAAFGQMAADAMTADLADDTLNAALINLVSHEPRSRTSVRRATRSSIPGRHVIRQADDRPRRVYELTIENASEPQRKRLQALWSVARFGTLPLVLPHFEDGDVRVVFSDDQLRIRKNSAVGTQLRATFEEVHA